MNDQLPETKIPATNAGATDAGGTIAAATTSAKKTTKVEKAEAPESTVVVTGPEKGRWRIGRKFTREPSSIPMSDLKDGDLAKLRADPELNVQVVDAPY